MTDTCNECGRRARRTDLFTLICSCGSKDTALKLCKGCLSHRPEIVPGESKWVFNSRSSEDICDDCDD
jgi:hypothetical protein